MSGCARIACTASLSPFTTLTTPGGPPASSNSSTRRNGQDGSRSDGFSRNVLPQVTASGNIQSGIIAGKLNGVIPAHTPRGCIKDQVSMPVPTSRLCSPFRRCGMPQANSTTSHPRISDPRASSSVLPCSREISSAISPACSSSSARYRNMIRARAAGGVACQAGSASWAACTAALTSADPPRRTCRATSPVDGLKTWPTRSDSPGTRRPPM